MIADMEGKGRLHIVKEVIVYVQRPFALLGRHQYIYLYGVRLLVEL